ncbi:acetyl-CoA acetyltransferase, cytosolic isoform X1 [Hydra vulgaris]|uniref:Acetyl-CoA acetyltransferase, cytosolic isoform X1 n=1 Tax=Hydra vulgaris TaxID=6087 RepID=A0ABM4BHE9_HYDVU
MSSMYKENDVVIVAAFRTPVGKYKKAFTNLQAYELGAVLIKKIIEFCDLNPHEVSEVIIGQVYTAGQGQNPARQSSVNGGLPYSVPSSLINCLCGSGLKAVVNAYQAIKNDPSLLIIAGGQESMSNVPHYVNVIQGNKIEDCPKINGLVHDGLSDAFYGYHMGITAENIAKQWNISREDQDKFALDSQQKISIALEEGHFKAEIVPVAVKTEKGLMQITKDEFPTPSTSLAGLCKLKPAFLNDGSGTVTAGNSSGINDGAAMMLICSMEKTKELKVCTPLARIVAWAQIGVEPSIMGIAPVFAVQKALKNACWTLEEVDLFELNEAFAAQSIAVIRELGIPMHKVNVCGGAIGIGHPIGASGARVLVTLLHSMVRLKKQKGVVSLCIGGGMGIAMCVERLIH